MKKNSTFDRIQIALDAADVDSYNCARITRDEDGRNVVRMRLDLRHMIEVVATHTIRLVETRPWSANIVREIDSCVLDKSGAKQVDRLDCLCESVTANASFLGTLIQS